MSRPNDGFTLIEMMIAVAILGIITAQTFVVFNTQKRVFLQNEKALDVQEDARLVVDLIGFDTRNGGFMIPSIAGLSSSDGGTSASDRFCVSDSSYFDYPGPTDVAEALDTAISSVDRSAITGPVTSNVTVSTLDIDFDNGTVDFVANAGIILSDGAKSHCARISSITGSTISFVAGHEPASGLFGDTTIVRAVPAIIYEVDDTNFNLMRNGLIMAGGVEDLQIEFWVDSGSTEGVIDSGEFPIHDLNNPGGLTMDTSLIRSVRLTVIARAVGEESGPNQRYNLNSRPTAGNRNAGTADSFKRRRFQSSISPRNLL
ncbi:MAG: prepilin-type N-terminal cleavage/methylation domain-containing protein [bacterium]|nr:prepilin-type N-terminal cleavage/methylation domain-containing protein [bacterium]